jgi:hypothetical protein
MDSEIDLSLPPPSTTQDSIESNSQNPKRGQSAHTTWIHTRTARDEENSRLKRSNGGVKINKENVGQGYRTWQLIFSQFQL